MMSRIPDIYKEAALRVVTPSDNGKIGVGFNTKSGEILRVNISIEDAFKIGHLARSHSLGSSGMPSVDVSSISTVSS